MCFFSLKSEWMYEVPGNRVYMLESVTFGTERIKEWDKYTMKMEKWGVECTESKTTGKECGQRKLQVMGKEWRTGRESCKRWEESEGQAEKEYERWEESEGQAEKECERWRYLCGKKRMFLGNLYDKWKKIEQYDVLREMGESCERAYWMAVRRRESNCRSIIIELLNGRAYCVGGWDYMTGSDSCCDEWWRCKKMATLQTDLLSYVM